MHGWLQVLVVLAAVTSIVAMLLVAAIVFVRRRHLVASAKPPPPPPTAVTWVNPAATVDDSKANNAADILEFSLQQQRQRQGVKRPARTAATLPLLRVNDLLHRDTSTSPARVSRTDFIYSAALPDLCATWVVFDFETVK